MRITGDDNVGKKQLDNFIDPDQDYPTVVTTSELLSTGVDCKTCGLIVIDKEIGSMTEFKQIVGRGTRLKTDKGKWHFEILDFRNATQLFKDPEFDGDPELSTQGSVSGYKPKEPRNGELHDDNKPRYGHSKYHVDGVEVQIDTETVPMGVDGKICKLVRDMCKVPYGQKTIKMKMEDLAECIQETRLNVSKVLNVWSDKGLIELKRSGWSIDDIRELATPE